MISRPRLFLPVTIAGLAASSLAAADDSLQEAIDRNPGLVVQIPPGRHTIVTHNSISGGMIGIKAMHGSTQLVIAEDLLIRIDLWASCSGRARPRTRPSQPPRTHQPALRTRTAPCGSSVT